MPVQAASEVDSMQKELTQAKVVVEAATQDCNALLEVITTSTADVETKQAVAIAKEEELKVPFTISLMQTLKLLEDATATWHALAC